MKCLDCEADADWKGRCRRCYARHWYHTPAGSAWHKNHRTKPDALAVFTTAFNCSCKDLGGYILSLRAAR